ncbi:MAG: MmgE/PrpD family protein [Candidatus Dormibacteraeota bacterium]|nr:MmgE/PrpD family protein [Candidatus Dormibacteraeota bacterium]
MSTRQLADWVRDVQLADLPGPAREAARRSILDTLGVALAGSGEEGSRLAREVVAGDGGGPATVWGTDLRLPVEAAAMLNGLSAHALDFDDVNSSSISHPSGVVLPACLACAEAVGSSGAELMLAYAVGLEVMAKLGRAMGEGYYRRGWHATSVLGSVGAAAAAGKLLGADAGGLLHALGISASMASGLRRNFGSMTKPLHAGLAARNGVAAARLGRAGFTADAEALEGRLGLFEAFEAELPPAEGQALEGLGRPWELEHGLTIKRYPCCYATHRSIDAALELRAARPELAEPSSAVVRVPTGGLAPLRPGLPATGLEGKFSMAYVVAVALLRGSVPLSAFTDDAVADSRVRELAERVEVREDPAVGVGRDGAEGGHVSLEVRTPTGTASTEVEYASGSPQRPMSFEEVAAKFRDCAAMAPVAAGGLGDLVLRLEDLPRAGEALSPLLATAAPQAVGR